MIKVLQIMGSLKQGGAETMIMNIYRKMNKDLIQFDFLIYKDEQTNYSKEILKCGGRVLVLQRKQKWNLLNYSKNLEEIIKKYGPYDAIQAHTNFHSGIALHIAKKFKIPVRLCNSHSTTQYLNESLFYKCYKILMRKLILNSATKYIACGQEAGESLYGKDKFSNDGKIIYNAIDINKFILKENNIKEEYYRKLKLQDCNLIIGSVASFREAKNHDFMLKIALELMRNSYSFKLIFVGEGPLKESIEKKANELGLSKSIDFLGNRTDVAELMHVFDVLLMPSLYEGFPVTLIESQAAGLPAIISNNIPKEVDLGLNLICALSLEDGISKWTEALIQSKKLNKTDALNRERVLMSKGFDINYLANLMMSLYKGN